MLYKSDIILLTDIISSFLLLDLNLKVYLIDNSPTDELINVVTDSRIEYMHNPSNPGFGASHNIAIRKAIEVGSNYHFIVNPDIFFKKDVITPMIEYLIINKDVGMMMPKILNLDGSVQHLPKLLPNPLTILLRKFKKPNTIYQKFINQYELRFVPQNVIYNTPILSGCFTLLNFCAR